MSFPAAPFAYVTGSSRLHRLDALPKLVWLVAAVAFSLAVYAPAPLLAVTVGALAVAVWAGVGGATWRAMRVLVPIAASIVVLQSLAPDSCGSGCTELARLGPFVISAEALGRGVSYVLRLVAMESVAVVMLVTTRPADLFGALRRLRVPQPVALLLATTMQLVPLLSRELTIVLDAQRARGLRASGLRAVVPALLPVFVAGFERTGRLAIAMEARGYGAAVRRTSYRTVDDGPATRALAWGGVASGAAGVLAGLTVWGASSVGPLVVPAAVAVVLVGSAAASFIALLAVGLLSLARA